MFKTISKGLLAFALLAAPVSVFADTVTEDFNSAFPPEGWVKKGYYIYCGKSRAHDTGGKGVYSDEKSNVDNYLITPELQGEISFYAATYNKSSYGYVILYNVNEDNTLGEELVKFETAKWLNNTQIVWGFFEYKVPSPQRIAIVLNYAAIDDFTYTPAEIAAGPALMVGGFENGSTYDFGGIPVSAGTTQAFTLTNTGSQTLNITSITVTGKYVIVEGSDIKEIEPGQSATVVIETPAEDTEGILSIESDDSQGTYEINLKSTYKEPAPIMCVDVKSIAFGKVTANAEQTVTVSNSGDAILIVEIESSSADFSVEPTQLTVEPEENVTVTVTYHYDANSVGAHSADITLKPNVGDNVVISASAIVKDPNVWSEDFESNSLPTGWDAGATWSFVDGVAKGEYKYNNNTYLTTPELKASEGDELTFSYKATGIVDIVIEASIDGGEFKQIKKISEESRMSEFKEYTIGGLRAGIYQFRFLSENYELDNFEGLKLVVKDHDLSIITASIPTQGTQYLEYVASVEVRELLGKDENVTATLYINEEAVASEEATVAASSTAQISLAYTPKEVLENGTARIVVEYADEYEVATEEVTVNIKAATVFDEESEAEIPAGTHDAIKIYYTAHNGWNIISFPFALNHEILSQIFGEDFTAYEFKEVKDGDIYLYEVTGKFVDGYAYVVHAQNVPENEDGIVLSNIKITFTNPNCDKWEGISLQAHFAPLTSSDTESCYTLAEEVSKAVTISLPKAPILQQIDGQHGFRGYFTIPQSSAEVPEVVLVDADGNVSGIVSIEAITRTSDDIYNLSGQKASHPAPGIYIVGGKKTVIK